MDKYVIIVAGGSGTRMGAEIPKQFIEINGKPILMHTMETFFNYNELLNIVLVLPAQQHLYWKGLCEKHNFTIAHKIANGGYARFHSVGNGLALIESNKALVAVHDGVRPLVNKQTLNNCFEGAGEKQAVVPVVPVIESIRRTDGESSEALNRSEYVLVQTPQVFEINLLRKAYKQQYECTFTDDASVVEKLGHIVHMVEGNAENIKITRPLDLKVAEALL
jgi:2-C-methyl-D-erythritol 4-phosphate cytidylyltransferase